MTLMNFADMGAHVALADWQHAIISRRQPRAVSHAPSATRRQPRACPDVHTKRSSVFAVPFLLVLNFVQSVAEISGIPHADDGGGGRWECACRGTAMQRGPGVPPIRFAVIVIVITM